MARALLKLRAVDGEDTQVMSAVLQDSIVPTVDMVFQKDSNSFVMVAQRLMREAAIDVAPLKANACERICCALTIKGVTAVQTQGIDLQDRARMLDLLAIILEPGEQHLSLIFAGEARIRLALSGFGAALEDFGEPWPALCNPCHDDAARSA